MKTLLLTGITGYLGSRTAARLLEEGFNVIGLTPCRKDSMPPRENLKLYYLDETSLEEVFSSNKPDGVIHFATCYGRTGESPARVAEVNLLFPLEILNLAVKHKTGFFINTDTILTPLLNPYALTKAQFAQWLKLYEDKITAVNMRLDHFYGPFDKPVKFIAFILRELKNKVSVIPLTQGGQTRDFIYIDDLISAYICVLNAVIGGKLKPGKIHNFEVATGSKHSIKELVTALKELTGNTVTKLDFGAVPYRKNEALDYQIDNSALLELGWKPSKTLLQGLKEIIKQEGCVK